MENQYQKQLEEYKKKIYDETLIKNPREYKKIYKEYQKLEQITTLQEAIKKAEKQLEENQNLLENDKDKSLEDLILEENETLKNEITEIKKKLTLVFLGNEDEDVTSIIMEIRAGTGGDEASLFAADLFRLYSKYSDKKNWKVEVLSLSTSGINGIKEIVFNVIGKKVYSSLQYETGVHRVQRVPETESSGRIHTSAVSVAVLKEAQKDDVALQDKDVKIDTYRASGAGGQHVNTTDSAIRLTHIPTGMVVTCQDERSQIKNKDKAFKVLRARLFEKQERERQEKFAKERKEQVGTGDRSEKIRTYNFHQGRISDHRIKLNLYNLEEFMNGEIEEVLNSLKNFFQEKKIKDKNIFV